MKKTLYKFNFLLIATCILLSSCSQKVEEIWSKVVDGATQFGSQVVKIAEPIIDNVTSGAQYVYDNVAHFTQESINNIQTKASEIIGNVEEYFTGVNSNNLEQFETKYSEISAFVNKDGDKFGDPQGFNHQELFSPEFEQFIPYYVSTILESYGYDVFAGVSFYKGVVYSGLIFTKGDIFIEYQGEETPTCGFVQLYLESSNFPVINEEIVTSGLVAIPNKTYSEEDNYKEAFIVTDSVDIDEQGGIFDDYYFEFRQINRFCLSIKVENELPDNYSSYPYEIYDFDKCCVIKEKEKDTVRDQLLKIYKNNSDAYEQGVLTNNAIAEMDECSSAVESINGIITFTDSDLNISQKELKEDVDKFIDSYDGSLEQQQINSFSNSSTFDEGKASEQIISLVSNSLGLVGTVVTVVIGVVAGTPVIKAIVLTTGISAIVYNVSNIIENVQSLYYGLNNLEDESVNPVYQAFASVISDKNIAKIVYHAWGISNSLISSLTIPISKSLSLSFSRGFGRFHTLINVVRAVLVKIAQNAIALIGGALVGSFVKKIVTYVTDSRFIGNIVGFGTTLIVAALIAKGLDKLDQKLNISGLYPKQDAAGSFRSSHSEKKKEYEYDAKNKDFSDLSRSEKEYFIVEIRDKACYELGIENKPTLNIVYDYTETASGYYDFYSNTLTINMASSENSSWRGISDTIGHECRHALQYIYAIENPDSEMAYSLSHYIRPEVDEYAYRHQTCEEDAFDFGAKFAELILSWLGLLSW